MRLLIKIKLTAFAVLQFIDLSLKIIKSLIMLVQDLFVRIDFFLLLVVIFFKFFDFFHKVIS